MKIPYQNIIDSIPSKPTIYEVSSKLFQLGHENEIIGDILDIDLTPNRGDCQSLNGILRDLNVFYDIDMIDDIYEKNISDFQFNFVNKKPIFCPKISFLYLEVDKAEVEYKNELKNYFTDNDLKRNNFFTDISNYISYETGQPTHCYDAKKINGELTLDIVNDEHDFDTLLGSKIKLTDNNLVFKCKDEIINLAGIMGGKSTSCNAETTQVIIECAYFVPEIISGKSVKYDLKSDAAYKFERGVDFEKHEYVLRRFAKIVENHLAIKNIKIFSKEYSNLIKKNIPIDVHKINTILGINLSNDQYCEYLKKLGFSLKDNLAHVPSYRNDISTQNDLAEEVARVIGYNNIENKSLEINTNSISKINHPYDCNNVRKVLSIHGFFEVINNPFVSYQEKKAISVDNPLDSSKKFLRTTLKQSLINNLLFNERRQKDSIKLYEISDIYSSNDAQNPKKIIGIIATGRAGQNYEQFSKKIDSNTIIKALQEISPHVKYDVINISRSDLETKVKTKIYYAEIELKDFIKSTNETVSPHYIVKEFKKYAQISDFPISTRDLSFSVKNNDDYEALQKLVLGYKHDFLKEVFIFDFFINKRDEIKIGFRLKFQSTISTITEREVNNVVDLIIKESLLLKSVNLPGLS